MVEVKSRGTAEGGVGEAEEEFEKEEFQRSTGHLRWLTWLGWRGQSQVRRESPWKVDGESTGVFSKLKYLNLSF
ncbi:hypothetical protein QJS10_CPB12g00742 [Acorus calamus]|uniref:Uncharacterized protein n=1 Tax=Acorus calamus TaxID=4465 RepID=A0AAV9DJ72_ACOCL|nr:hypothetical protein QJS10_CPB12g00742 [Acorus calamus]